MAKCKMPDCENEVDLPLLLCRDCMMGCDVPEESMGLKEDAMPPKRNKQYSPPTTCRTCGLAVNTFREDGSEVLFYPSRPDVCIRCINKRAKDKGRGSKGAWAPINEPTADLAQNVYLFAQPESTPAVAAEPGLPYVCEIHGPHAGYHTGGRYTRQCPQCGNKKRLDGMAAHNERMAAMARIMKRYPFLMTFLEESAAKGGNESPYDAMAQIVIESISPEWFKAWALRGVN